MSRYKITIEYDGSKYHGWQKQLSVETIQGKIERALYHFTQEKIDIYGACRTDTGVHALSQIAHFDLNKFYDDQQVINALNFYLNQELISIRYIKKVSSNFHARFSAIRKKYVYHIINRTSHPTLDKNKAWHVKSTLNVDHMNQTSRHLIGYNNLESFRTKGCQNGSPNKSIESIIIKSFEDKIYIEIIAKSFLYNQVRIIVGTLVDFCIKRYSPNYIQHVIQAQDRRLAGTTAPGYGLYLYEIFYR